MVIYFLLYMYFIFLLPTLSYMQLHSFVASFYILFHIFYLYLWMVCLLFFFFSKPSHFIICIMSSNHLSEFWMQELFFPHLFMDMKVGMVCSARSRPSRDPGGWAL
ncbi:hypothetical protein I7I53_11933 [Histoplasma capsulatum var. duboisii H88]|uniref:Uncharacterized protein n=1 Tax=Ajellomyces capsulatus (strain H88) TaxID=544711 RepID=A0A8A1LTZ4_AJEC8|nr:hypothetical protein I7I53_11933 [Histoplasma capsulatum var. duboisii H88]